MANETMVGKIARKYMAHFIDTDFNPGSTLTGSNAPTPAYYRLGKDLEEYTTALNPDVSVIKNIIGETNVTNNGYQRSGSAQPFYAEIGDPLFEKLQVFVDTEPQDDTLRTTLVEVHLWDEGSTSGSYKAWRQDVYIVPNSYGGDTSGYQIPFDIYYVGARTEGTFALATKTFTANA